ncbi:hypothetical protein KPH11_07375 [Klebsiella pneumoniae subsp. pneumoniae]|nr:hypothetical protein A4U70_14705 [Klebsiella pneumoniae]ATU15880.1 hypothetical protein KPH11_07375 [Klebsiella pneumoniae subsp. pneumoniae]
MGWMKMVIARSLVTKIEGELARWPRCKCLFFFTLLRRFRPEP